MLALSIARALVQTSLIGAGSFFAYTEYSRMYGPHVQIRRLKSGHVVLQNYSNVPVYVKSITGPCVVCKHDIHVPPNGHKELEGIEGVDDLVLMVEYEGVFGTTVKTQQVYMEV
jgi:hypothetical protein